VPTDKLQCSEKFIANMRIFFYTGSY